jgi:uncharacterized protein YbjT (DUF2867 family)
MTHSQILVTGATGNVGREVIRALQRKGTLVRAGVRNPEKTDLASEPGVEVVGFDFLDPTTFEAAFVGIKRLFLVRPPALGNVETQIAPAVWAAVQAGVEHIVFLSVQGVEDKPIIPHHKIESLIKQTGVQYTFLRAGFFMQNLSTTHRDEIRNESVIALPVGKAKTSFVDVRDLGEVGARALTEAEHADKSYTLTGPQSLDYAQIAQQMSRELGREIVYTDPSPFRFLWRQVNLGNTFSHALVMTALYVVTRFGNAEEVSDDVPSILGRPAIDFDQFVRDYRECWQPTSQQSSSGVIAYGNNS